MRRGLIALALALAAAPGGARDTGGVDFIPAFVAGRGLVLHLDNLSKLPKPVEGIDVAIGSIGTRRACRLELPPLVLAPAGTAVIVIATPATLDSCFGRAVAPARGFDLPAAPGFTIAGRPLPLVRIMPRVAGRASVDLSFVLAPPGPGRRP